MWCPGKSSTATAPCPMAMGMGTETARRRRSPSAMGTATKSFSVNWKNPTTMFGYSMASKYSTSCVSMRT